MIKFLKPEVTYQGKLYSDGEYLGDFIHGDVSLLGNFDKSLYEKPYIPLATISFNTLTALNNLNIDTVYFDNFQYECPFTKRKYFGVLPLAIIGDDIKKYIENNSEIPLWKKEMLLDYNYQRDYFNEKTPIEELQDDITIALMGPGYTTCCYPSDGSKSLTLSTIPMDNGDIMVCINYCWFNK